MSGLVLLSLPLSLLLFSIFVAIAFLDAAIRRPASAGAARCEAASSPWPTLEFLKSASRLTGEDAGRDSKLRCPEAPFVPRVTTLEARAIASEIERQGAVEVHRVLSRSRVHDGICPMRLNNGLCACSVARPLDCIGRCFARADSPEWAEGLGQTVSMAFHEHLKHHHTNATTRRLDEALLDVLVELPATDSSST